jgi:hypothetical protein
MWQFCDGFTHRRFFGAPRTCEILLTHAENKSHFIRSYIYKGLQMSVENVQFFRAIFKPFVDLQSYCTKNGLCCFPANTGYVWKQCIE